MIQQRSQDNSAIDGRRVSILVQQDSRWQRTLRFPRENKAIFTLESSRSADLTDRQIRRLRKHDLTSTSYGIDNDLKHASKHLLISCMIHDERGMLLRTASLEMLKLNRAGAGCTLARRDSAGCPKHLTFRKSKSYECY